MQAWFGQHDHVLELSQSGTAHGLTSALPNLSQVVVSQPVAVLHRHVGGIVCGSHCVLHGRLQLYG